MNSSKLQKYIVYYNNSEEYHQLKREVFTQDLYHFETDKPSPVIIDAGAHIGLSVLYFKQLYPSSQIIAIEPNPESFKLLKKNIFENQIEGVTLIQAALSDKSGSETLFSDETSERWHSTAGFHNGSWVGTQKSNQTSVQTHTLSEFVTKPIDFLKMDIEGVEQKVLSNSLQSLPLIKQMSIEFHTHKTQSLNKLVELLERTHDVDLYQGTKIIELKKAKGLVMIEAKLR
jgi:FkbM family methyltransferase